MVFVLDASGILNDFLFDTSKKYITTNYVLQEIRDFRSRILIEEAFKKGNLKVIDPTEEEIEKIRKKHPKLSIADASVVALATKLKNCIVLTDDLPLEWALKKRGIKTQRIMHHRIKF
jgi:UPF0271 protein